MNQPIDLRPSVGLGPVAAALDTSTVFITRVLRTIVWFGLAQPVILFLQEEEARVASLRARKRR